MHEHARSAEKLHRIYPSSWNVEDKTDKRENCNVMRRFAE